MCIKLIALNNKANRQRIAVNKYENIHFALWYLKCILIETEFHEHIIIAFS